MSTTIRQTLRTPSARYVGLGLAALAVSIRTLGAGFVHWDDVLLTGKLAVHGLSAEHLRAILIPSGSSYQPLRDLAFALTYAFSGNSPRGYHLVNVILYVATCLLAYRVLETLISRAKPESGSPALAAWLGALVFAVHPLHVEAFAWVQGNKDLLAGMFFLGAFLAWIKFGKSTGKALTAWYLAAFFLFLLALASKPSAAAFPLVILAYDLIFNRSKSSHPGRIILRHLPYWAPAFLLAVYFIFYTDALRNTSPNADNILAIPKILAACYRLTFLPLGLLHRYNDPVFSGFADIQFWFGLLATLGALGFAFVNLRRRKLVSFGIIWYYLCWLPQSNLAPLSIRVADRYLFLSLLGFALPVGILAARLISESRTDTARNLARTAACLVIFALGALSLVRGAAWHDSLSLWESAVAAEPKSDFLRRGLADVYIEQGEPEKAFHQYEKALELNPYEPKSLVNMGYIRKTQGRDDDALQLYERALRLQGDNFNALNSIGNIYAARGEDSLAVEFYRRALDSESYNYMARYNLAAVYRRLGRENAADSLLDGLESGPLPEPLLLLMRGRDFIREGRLDSARARFERALTLDRELRDARAGLGEVLLLQDSLERAVETLRPLLSVGSPEWTVLSNLGLAWDRRGNLDSALVYYRQAWSLAPDSASSGLNYAVALNRADSTSRAIEVATSLAERNPSNPMIRYNLGNWLIGAGEYAEAAAQYRAVLALDPRNDRAHLNLGLLFMRNLGWPDSALFHLRRCIEIAPNQPQAEVIGNAIRYLEGQTRP